MKRCPMCGNKKFFVTAHVTQDWLVDENGNFIEEIDSCIETTHSPDDMDLWQCDNCFYEACGCEFNVKE